MNSSNAHDAGPHINQTGFYFLSTPTLFGTGWGRQDVDTKLDKIRRTVRTRIASRTTPWANKADSVRK